MDRPNDSYPLSPVQQGMLFHGLFASATGGVYVQQMVLTLAEGLDTAVFRRAWERVVARHDILRTRFQWEGLDQPVQIVEPKVDLPWDEQDWRGSPADQQEARFESYLGEDRKRGFSFAQAPLLRLAIFRRGDADYRVVWTFHHILLDGRSHTQVLKEAFGLYDAFRRGEDPAPRPYREFIDWLQGYAPDGAESYWRQLLSGFRTPTPLLSVASLQGRTDAPAALGERSLYIPTGLTSALSAVAKQQDVTVNALLQGAWAILLGRYSGEPDVIFGTSRAGRHGTVDGAESMIGLFITTVPVRCHVAPESPVLESLKELRTQALAIRPFEHVPLVKVREWSDVAPGASFFDTLMVFESYQMNDALRAEGGTWANRSVRLIEKTNYPLVLAAYGGTELVLKLLFDPQRFDDATIDRMLGHLQTLLEGMAADATRTVASLPLLTDAERRQMVDDWNHTRADFPARKCIHQLVEDQAARTPEAAAVVFEEKEFTYAQINARANQLAHHLRSLGVGPGKFVTVCLKRSADAIVGLLGILKAGGAYVPLDPAYPKDRIAFMLEDTQAPVLLTQQELLDGLPAHTAKTVCLDADWPAIATLGSDNPPCATKPDDLAYVIYTSGSTGKPKGVVLKHRPVVNTLDWVNKTFKVGPGDRLLFVTSICFDLSVYDIFGTLAAGATIRIASSDDLRDPERLLKALCEEPITFWDSAPPTLQQLAPFFASVKEEARHSKLRLVFLSGDWIPVPLPDQVRETFPQAQVISLGGATEAAIWSNWYPIGTVDPKWPSIPYGKPMQNCRYHILDANLNPVPIGVPGELHIGGICLASGYLNRPELTAERFIPDPFGRPGVEKGTGTFSSEKVPVPFSTPGDRLYKTGDLARYFPDGNIEFLGRIDHQVKVRGYRVELGEIETVLAKHPAVRECVVIARPDSGGVKQLVVYAVATPDHRIDAKELRAYLGEHLPDYMVPTPFVPMGAMPLNPNGKIDRKALPDPSCEQGDDARPYTAPRDAVEEALAAMWAEVLGVPRVGIHDDFFALGGHSLNATQVVSRIRKHFGVEVPLPAFFQAKTIATLGPGLQIAQEKASQGAAISPLPGPRHHFPASFAQQRFWFIDQFGHDREVYDVPYAIRIHGHLNVDALENALRDLAARHEALRTTFADKGGTLMQVIAPEPRVEMPIVDLSEMSPTDREEEVESLSHVEGRQHFDLVKGPLWTTKLLRLGPEEHVLLLTLHHIITDGWSMWVFFQDLGKLYDAVAAGRTANLPAPLIQYADFSDWQRRRFESGVLKDQVDYWKQRLAGPLPTLQLPTARSRPPSQTFRGAVHMFRLPAKLVAALQTLTAREEATPFMAWLAAFNCLLHRYTYQEDLLVGSPIANRNRSEIEGVVGVFINTLVMRTDMSGDPSFLEVLQRVRTTALEAFSHQEVPFDLLITELNPEREPGTSPVFQVMFNHIHGATQVVEAAGTRWSALPVPNGTAKFDLTLTLEETPDGLVTFFEYNTDLFVSSAIERMAGHFRTLLDAVVANPQKRVSQLPLLTDAEREQLLVEWNATARAYPRDRCAYQLVAEQAARTSERVAVVFENRLLTYGELNRCANQLAHHLRTLGVGPDVLVGLCMERSADMVVGLLGILKAGGAYVPLDPDFPQDRLAFYAEDSKMPVLVTQEKLLGKVPAPGAQVLCLDRDGDAIALNPDTDPVPVSTPEHLAYVIYTSGSTGKPKGVQVVQRAKTNFLNSMRREPGLTESDILMSVTTLSFDIHVLEVWLPLIVGARLVVISRADAGDGSQLLERLTSCGATLLQATPATWRLLMAAGWKGDGKLKALCGGEPMTVELAKQLLERVGELWNMYGPTETTVWSTIQRVTSAAPPILIGRPIDNTTIYLLDRHMNPVPVGAPGELMIGGDGLARGYLNRPELTGEKFVRDPFKKGSGYISAESAAETQPDPFSRIYKTGDVARYLPDGTIECLGRVDHQVKVRGYRIELGEIETVLAQQPAVRSAVVVARKDESGADTLIAYVIPNPGADGSSETLRAGLKEKLPDYMVPSYFVSLEQWPLTPNGKIDRKQLPAPSEGSNGSQRVIVAPATDPERALAPIWEEVLKVKPIGITDNFFDLGGHSFLAAVLMARIKTQLGHSLPLGALFAAPTIEKLGKVMQDNLEAGTGTSIVPFNEQGSKPPLFMIAGVGGHVFTFHRFAQMLGKDQPVYGVKAVGIDGTTRPPDRIEDIAAIYAKEITALRPHGPYLLSGYSIGAVVAYELALQLRRAGHKVELLIVFDMNAPGYPKRLPLPRRVLMHLGNFARLGMQEKKSYLAERIGNVKVRLLRKLGLGVLNAPEIQGVDALPQDAIKRVWAALVDAQLRYLPREQFDGNVLLFKAEEGFQWAATVMDDPRMGWDQWTSVGVEAHSVPGGHMEVFSDANIGAVAERLKGCIQRVTVPR